MIRIHRFMGEGEGRGNEVQRREGRKEEGRSTCVSPYMTLEGDALSEAFGAHGTLVLLLLPWFLHLTHTVAVHALK